MAIKTNQLQELRDKLNQKYLERRDLVDGMLVSLISGQPLLMLGPPGCLSGDTELVYLRGKRNSGRKITLKEFHAKFNGLPSTYDGTNKGSKCGSAWDLAQPTYLHSLKRDGEVFYNKVVRVWEAGVKSLIKLSFDDGSFIRLTKDHPVATPNGEFVEAGELSVGDSVLSRGSMKAVNNGGKNLSLRPPRVVVNVKYHPNGSKSGVNGYVYKRVARARLMVESKLNNIQYDEFIKILKTDQIKSSTFEFLSSEIDVHHINEDTLNDNINNLQPIHRVKHSKLHSKKENFSVDYTKEVIITSVCEDGKEMTYDIQMSSPANNFCANGIIVHNTAKSMICQDICNSIQGDYFDWMLSKLTVPEELFGPLSLKGLENDKYIRLTEGYLPEANIGFLDEVFKGSSAILNTLLTVLNEKKFYNGGKAVAVPLLTMYAASNEIPTSEELSAFYDRFVLRFAVDYVKNEQSARTLFTGLQKVDLPKLSISLINDHRAEASKVELSSTIIDLFLEIRQQIAKDGIMVSDRKWVQSVEIIQALAHLNGRTKVEPDDFDILANVLWSSPDQRTKVRRLVSKISNPVGDKILQIMDSLNELVRDLNNGKGEPIEVFKKLKMGVKELEKIGDPKRNAKLEAAIIAIKGNLNEIAKNKLGLMD